MSCNDTPLLHPSFQINFFPSGFLIALMRSNYLAILDKWEKQKDERIFHASFWYALLNRIFSQVLFILHKYLKTAKHQIRSWSNFLGNQLKFWKTYLIKLCVALIRLTFLDNYCSYVIVIFTDKYNNSFLIAVVIRSYSKYIKFIDLNLLLSSSFTCTFWCVSLKF